MRTLCDQVEAVAAGTVSPVDLVEQALKDIERTQPTINAFTQVYADAALTRAKELESAGSTGPLHGVPVAVKDLYDVDGTVSSGCCASYAERVATSDSVVVAKLRKAGAIIIGKTNQHELACGATTLVSSHGPCLNPWDNARIPGGSSGGSGAAVAAGVVAMAMGSDTGGSIRIPSSFCGTTGLKPTHGNVSLRGAMPMCPSLDTAGPLARSAADCELVHSVICGPDHDYLWSRTGPALHAPRSFEGLRIGLPRSYFTLIHTEVRRGVEEAASLFEGLGADIVEVDGPDINEAFTTFTTRLAEVAHCYRDLWDDHRVSQGLGTLIGLGRNIGAADFFAGREIELKVKRDFHTALADADVLLAPCTAYPAPRIDDVEIELEGGKLDVHSGGPARLTMPVNVAGLPAIAFPVAFSSVNTPVGAQLIGHEWSEHQLCAIVSAYQDATDWHIRSPNESRV